MSINAWLHQFLDMPIRNYDNSYLLWTLIFYPCFSNEEGRDLKGKVGRDYLPASLHSTLLSSYFGKGRRAGKLVK